MNIQIKYIWQNKLECTTLIWYQFIIVLNFYKTYDFLFSCGYSEFVKVMSARYSMIPTYCMYTKLYWSDPYNEEELGMNMNTNHGNLSTPYADSCGISF